MIDLATSAHVGKADHIAQELLRFIIESQIESGSSVGTETDLLARYEVSRPTLRESLRILESQGIVERRPGPGGGIIARKPSLERLAYLLSVFLYFNKVPFGSALKAREVIEPALASEAALHGSDADFADMRASIARLRRCKGHEAFLHENLIFHGIVARASGNQVLKMFWQALSMLAGGEVHGGRFSPKQQKQVVEALERILKACSERNPATAGQAMAEHVGELEMLVRRRYQHLLDEPQKVLGLTRNSNG